MFGINDDGVNGTNNEKEWTFFCFLEYIKVTTCNSGGKNR